MTQSLTTYEAKPIVSFDAERVNVLKTQLAKGCSDAEIALFIQVCQRTGLDPFAKQIYAIPRKTREQDANGRWQSVTHMVIQTGIDGYRLICQRAGNYAGMDGPYWCGPDGEWVDVWLRDDPPAAAKVGVRATGDSDWTYHVATYREYVQTVGQGEERKPNTMWATMPANQLAKCAEAGARRKRWSVDLSNVYIDAEIAATDRVLVTTAERALDASGPEPKAIKAPKRKSDKAKKGTEAAPEPQQPELDENAMDSPSEAPAEPVVENFGIFWNSLGDRLEAAGKTIGDVGMVLNIEPSAPALRKWYDGQKGDRWAAIQKAFAEHGV